MSDLSRFHNHLLQNHTSCTKPRDLVYIRLWEYGPCATTTLVEVLQGTIDRATIYRSIQLFLTLGIIAEINPNLFELTDRFKQHHHYFVCHQCGRQTPFNDPSIEKALTRLAAHRNLT